MYFTWILNWSFEKLVAELRRCEASEYLKNTNYRMAIVAELKRR
jgi:hypothetical protein